MSFYLFPGQGSQVSGMGLSFYDNSPVAREIFDLAATICPGNFLDIIFQGESDTVNHTRVAQPALLTVSTAISRHLSAKNILPIGCAGHSLGEISALVAAEVCSFEDALRFTLERARLMSENVPEGGMAAIMGYPPEDIEACLVDKVWIANYNGPQQTIISGEFAALQEVIQRLNEAGAKRVIPLNVSGPFHSGFMKAASIEFSEIILNVPFTPPRCTFISSVTGAIENDPDKIRELLAQQLYSPIRWTQVMETIGEQPAYEVGPGSVLKGLAKRTPDAPLVQTMGTWDEACALSTA